MQPPPPSGCGPFRYPSRTKAHLSKDLRLATFNARVETLTTKPLFRDCTGNHGTWLRVPVVLRAMR